MSFGCQVIILSCFARLWISLPWCPIPPVNARTLRRTSRYEQSVSRNCIFLHAWLINKLPNFPYGHEIYFLSQITKSSSLTISKQDECLPQLRGFIKITTLVFGSKSGMLSGGQIWFALFVFAHNTLYFFASGKCKDQVVQRKSAFILRFFTVVYDWVLFFISQLWKVDKPANAPDCHGDPTSI